MSVAESYIGKPISDEASLTRHRWRLADTPRSCYDPPPYEE